MSTHNLLSRYNYRAERWKSVIQSQHNVLTNSPAKEKQWKKFFTQLTLRIQHQQSASTQKHDKINDKNFLHNLATENTARN